MTPTIQVFDNIILGGGFAGVYAAKSLSRELGRKAHSHSIAIVASENHMVFQPMLPEVAGAALSPRHVVNPIRSLCKSAKVFKAQATGIDLDNRVLKLSVGDFVGNIELGFKQIGLCLGAKIDLSAIPGMQEHSLLLQNVGDAMRIRAHFVSRLEEANLAFNADVRRRLLSFVIVGGGYSGVETAGQFLDLARAIYHQYKNISWEDFRFTLIHSRDHLLPTLNKKLGKYAESHLKKRSLDIQLERRARAITANRVYLDDGSHIETNTVICTVGNAPHPLVTSLNREYGIEMEWGRLKTLADCSISGFPSVWAAGDCALVPQKDGTPSPPTAQFALRQGELMGRNMARQSENSPTKPFAFTAIGELASIGHHSAVAEIKGLRFSGLFAWWMWRSIYLMKLPGIERKMRVVFDWTLELFFPRDINLLNPQYSTGASETHLEKGDVLFHQGDPAFSFYIVKSGAIELRDNGKKVKTVLAHQHFGERALLEKTNYLFQAVALEPTTLVTIRNSLFQQIVLADSSFASFLKQTAQSNLTHDELEALISRLGERQLARLVRDAMSSNLATIDAQSTIGAAITRFKAESKNYLPIIDSNGIPIGALKKESLYIQMLSSELDFEQPIKTLPFVQLPKINQDSSLQDALILMSRNNASKALATDEEGRLVGIIAIIDIMDTQLLSTTISR